MDPLFITHCPCGGATVSSLLKGSGISSVGVRESCLDPIPTCSNVCSKILSCGDHRCELKCHLSNCLPCAKTRKMGCRCKKQLSEFSCKDLGPGFNFLCENVCGERMHCNRHKCELACCDMDYHLCESLCAKALKVILKEDEV